MTEKELRNIFINPFYAINISEGLVGKHEPMVTKEDWVKANIKLINGSENEKGMGLEEWLETLLDVLEGGYTK